MKINSISYTFITLAFMLFLFIEPDKVDTILLIGCLFFLVRIADKLYEK